jgi:hypothetical protein
MAIFSRLGALPYLRKAEQLEARLACGGG